MRTIISPIVGMHFRPPAKWVIAVLPRGCQLRLEPEPENPYDEHAVQVWVEPRAIPASRHAELEQALEGCGMVLDQVLSSGSLMLGYLASEKNTKALAPGLGEWEANVAVGPMLLTGDWQVTLLWGPSGEPLCRVRAEGGASAPAEA